MLEKGIVVPNPVLTLNNIISTMTDGQNISAMKQEKQRFRLAISKNGIDCMYFVIPRKNRDRDTIVKKFNKEMTRILQA